MSEFFIAPIVDGQGEVQAAPALLHRLYAECHPGAESRLRLNHPIRVKAGSFLHDAAYFSKHIALAALKAKPHPRGAVLILLECEDECPAKLGPTLWQRAREVRADVPCLVALAFREYETWLVAAARSLRGVAGLPPDLDPPADPESIRDGKGWLAARMRVAYNEPNHQLELTRRFAFEEAAVVPSFARLRRLLHQMFTASI